MNEPLYAEVRNNYTFSPQDESDGLLAGITIDGWKTADDSEEGVVIAAVLLSRHGDIIVDWHDNSARQQKNVLDAIKEAKARLRDYSLPESDYKYACVVTGEIHGVVDAKTFSDAGEKVNWICKEAKLGVLRRPTILETTVELIDMKLPKTRGMLYCYHVRLRGVVKGSIPGDTEAEAKQNVFEEVIHFDYGRLDHARVGPIAVFPQRKQTDK